MTTSPLPADTPPPAAKHLSGRSIIRLVVIVCLVVAACVFVLNYLRNSLDAAQAVRCKSNFIQLSMAILTYQDAHGTRPPAYLADAEGKPMHSWRVLILPYLGDPIAKEVYENYRFDEPWNSEHNQQFVDRMPAVYRCAGDPGDSTHTHYLAVVGKGTVWPGDQSVGPRDIHDGQSKTICLVDDGATSVPWLEPRDISPEAFVADLANQIHGQGAVVAMADGSVFQVRPEAPASATLGMLTRSGGETIDETAVMTE